MFWCVPHYLDAFETVWLPYRTQCKSGRTCAKVHATKSRRNFSQQTHPIHPIGPLPHVSGCFVLFGCIWDSLLRYNTQFKTGQTCAKVHATKSRRNFSQLTHPIHHIGLSSCFGVFCTIWMHLDRLVALQNGPNWCKSSGHGVGS